MNLPEMPTVREQRFWVCLLLVLIVWLGFGQALQCGFVNYDDDFFVYNNLLVIDGLSVHGIVQALTRVDQNFYYPLCTISFMLDSTVYGINPFGFHLTNVLLHMTSVVLLFLVLQKMTGSMWRSVLAAAFFAVHPLRVESVVWITERKDVLSGLFFMLTLLAYLSYARRPFSLRRYAAVFLLYLAGLMSKPMLVSLPFALLLLDWWPLRRFSAPFQRVFLEKIPLLVLSVCFCIVTLAADTGGGVVVENLPFSWRVYNALISYVAYIRQMVFPVGLALPYPSTVVSFAEAGAALLFLSIFSVTVILLRKKKPYLLTGWFWYLGMLVPVLGLFRVLGTARADRFTYLPQIGLCLLLVWATADWCTSVRRRVWLSVFAFIVLAGLVTATRHQSTYWRDSETLWNHTLSCTAGNSVAHSNLGTALFVQGRTQEAIPHFQKAIELGTKQAEVFNNLGTALADTGDYAGAVRQYLKALAIDPERAEILKNLADSFAAVGDTERAMQVYELALQKAIGRQDEQAAARIRAKMELCERQKPYHEAPVR